MKFKVCISPRWIGSRRRTFCHRPHTHPHDEPNSNECVFRQHEIPRSCEDSKYCHWLCVLPPCIGIRLVQAINFYNKTDTVLQYLNTNLLWFIIWSRSWKRSCLYVAICSHHATLITSTKETMTNFGHHACLGFFKIRFLPIIILFSFYWWVITWENFKRLSITMLSVEWVSSKSVCLQRGKCVCVCAYVPSCSRFHKGGEHKRELLAVSFQSEYQAIATCGRKKRGVGVSLAAPQWSTPMWPFSASTIALTQLEMRPVSVCVCERDWV